MDLTSTIDRRAFVRRLAMAAAAGGLVPGAHTHLTRAPAAAPARVEAVLFDAFPIFDPRPVAALAERLYPGRGAELMTAWRTRQFEYQWLRLVMDDWADFRRCTEEALRWAAAACRLDLDAGRRDALVGAFSVLRPWPDVPPALRDLRGAGIRLGFLSNFAPSMLADCIAGSGLADAFEHVVTTERARTHKPAPRAYQLGVEALGLPKERILFAAFAGWDAAGAKRFGYSTFWVNRLGAPREELGVAPDGEGPGMAELVAFVRSMRGGA